MNSQRGFKIGSLLGVPINVRASALVFIVLFSVAYFPYFQRHATTNNQALIAAVALGVAIALSVLLHEIAHVLGGKLFGVKAHEISLTFFGGHAQFESSFAKPWHSVVTSLAGPATNLALGAILVITARTLNPLSVSLIVIALLHITGVINIMLGVFNALPGLPLDGGHALTAAVWHLTRSKAKGTLVAARSGQVLCVLIILWFIGLPLIQSKQLDMVSVMWTVVLVSILWSGAAASVKNAQIFAKGEAIDINSLIRPALQVPTTLTVAQLRTQLAATPITVAVLTHDGATFTGLIDPQAVMAVPDELASTITLESVSIVLPTGSVVTPDAQYADLLTNARVGESIRNLYVVSDTHQLHGVLWIKDLVAALNT